MPGADRRDRGVELVARVDRRERRHRNAELAEQGFFREAILRDGQRARAREHRNAFAEPLRRFGGDVFEIERGDVDSRGEFGERRFVAIIADHHRRELSGAGIGRGVHDQEAQAQRCAGKREHAGQLPAAEDADGGHGAMSFGAQRAAIRCADRRWQRRRRSGASRNAASAAAMSGSSRGQHRGGEQRRVGRAGLADRERRHGNSRRHLHDRQQRIEAVQRLRLHRHAEHRQRGLGGSMPGRCAAPPAPAMITSMPRAARRGGVFEQQVRRAMGGNDAHFVRRRRACRASRRRAASSPSRNSSP